MSCNFPHHKWDYKNICKSQLVSVNKMDPWNPKCIESQVVKPVTSISLFSSHCGFAKAYLSLRMKSSNEALSPSPNVTFFNKVIQMSRKWGRVGLGFISLMLQKCFHSGRWLDKPLSEPVESQLRHAVCVARKQWFDSNITHGSFGTSWIFTWSIPSVSL